jgi:serine protease AprX
VGSARVLDTADGPFIGEKSIESEAEMTIIFINGISFDPLADRQILKSAGMFSEDASKSDYILIQFTSTPDAASRKRISRAHVEILEYVSENTYLCYYKDKDLSKIRSLRDVTWADIYFSGFKIPPNLRDRIEGGLTQLVPRATASSHSNKRDLVDIVFHDNVDPTSPFVRKAIAEATRLGDEILPTGRHKIRVTIPGKYLDDIAAIDGVRVILRVPALELKNNIARNIINANVIVNGTTYQGEGQIISVADSGFDKGSTKSPHPAFKGRVAKLYNLTGEVSSNDTDGHGTHVCGSALGDGLLSTGVVIQGVAPKATLVVQKIMDYKGNLTPGLDLADLFGTPFRDDGARVHSNSWGASNTSGLRYSFSQSAREIDDFVWNNPELVICWAAGNDGLDGDGDGVVDPAQIGNEAAAKNCITVGASESVRLEIEPVYATYGSGPRAANFPSAPIHDDPYANNAEGMAALSSRGPTQERRFKPDLVAPGTSILSAKSRDAPKRTTFTDFGKSSEGEYFFDTGTSMATPIVAGCAAVLRETLVSNGMGNPTAALIKALLINGAADLLGQYSPSEAGPSFNISSGFGRVNLLGSVILPGPNPNAGIGEGKPLGQGDNNTFTVNIPGQTRRNRTKTTRAGGLGLGGNTYKITLVWADPAGAELQNDLDLVVVAADGNERHGNMGLSKGFDRLNNVEQVFWANMPPGLAKITISAFRITRFPQPYAYAWRLS